MTLSDLASIGSLVSGIAVLVSLIYLSLQVKQAERNQQALIRQGRTERAIDILIAGMEPSMTDAITRVNTGAANVTSTELDQYFYWQVANFRSYEDSFWQHKEGLLTASDFDGLVTSITFAVGLPAARLAWRRTRDAYHGDFVKFVDELVAKTPIRKWATADALGQWNADMNAEMAGAAR